jgi:hypothetical protein
MRAVTVRRSQADIADDIASELRPLKRGAVRPEPAISQHIEIINKIVADYARIGAAADIRQRAARAVRALADLEEVFPGILEFNFRSVRRAIELLMYIKGPDRRANNLHWLCAHQAIVLIEEFSKTPPSQAAGGNAHLVAQLLFEAVTGKPSSDFGLLKALKKVLKWRFDGTPGGTTPAFRC